jgi:hypothetical protein
VARVPHCKYDTPYNKYVSGGGERCLYLKGQYGQSGRLKTVRMERPGRGHSPLVGYKDFRFSFYEAFCPRLLSGLCPETKMKLYVLEFGF